MRRGLVQIQRSGSSYGTDATAREAGGPLGVLGHDVLELSRNGDDETRARPRSAAPCQTPVMWLRITEGFTFALKQAAAAACLLLQVWVVSAQAAGSTEKHLEAARLELQRRSDADSLAAAGVLTAQHNRSEGLALVSRAADAAPERADLVWLQLMLCQQAPSCDSEALEQRLRQLDPSNGAAWMGALSRAGSQGRRCDCRSTCRTLAL